MVAIVGGGRREAEGGGRRRGRGERFGVVREGEVRVWVLVVDGWWEGSRLREVGRRRRSARVW